MTTVSSETNTKLGNLELVFRGIAEVGRESSEGFTGMKTHTLKEHLETFGPTHTFTTDTIRFLLDEMEKVNLTGRGGGHFPAHVKWKSVMSTNEGGIVVVNGAEGEPGSAKDAALLQLRPHLVLDGLDLAMLATNATEGVIWLHEGAWASAEAIGRAMDERAARNYETAPIRVFFAPARYVSGEATSIIQTLEGGPTLPRHVRNPARPWTEGSKPVLVNNTETMARIGHLARTGAGGYHPASMLTVINQNFRRVVEAGSGVTFGKAIESLWVSPDGFAPKAVLLGGYGGSWVSWDKIKDLPVDNKTLKEHNLSLGAGLVAPLPAGACGLKETARLMRYLSGQSAKQCGPCVFGLSSVADLVDELAYGKLGKASRKRLTRFMLEINGRGACRHPDGALRMLGSSLEVFHDEVEHHLHKKHCQFSASTILPIPMDAI